jgi:Na+-translocating ferredoxin:NAD+ oxidoreductase subunit C
MTSFKHGGIHPPENKFTRDYAIEECPFPDLLTIPLNQHIGKPAKALVKPKQEVKRGELIGAMDGFVSCNVHATTSGIVKKVDRVPHQGGGYSDAILLEPDGEDIWHEDVLSEPCDVTLLSQTDVLERIKDAGIVGMGGAGFPAHVKLMPPEGAVVDTFILNGAECEPFLTSDFRLMLEKPNEILKGVDILKNLFGEKVEVYIGIEKNKPEAIELLQKKSTSLGFKVIGLDAKYPQGSEKQLIQALTGREVAEKQLPFSVGCVVQNVATAYAIYEAVTYKRPLTERVMTVSGMEIANRKNLRVRLGTRFADILEFCGGLKNDINQLISGGPMMGKAQYSFEVPVTKTTSGLLFIDNKELDRMRERPCIRCGKCLSVCPQGMSPSVMADKSQNNELEQLPELGLHSCMECGSCAYVCPSKRDIVHWIKYSKAIVANKAKHQKS